MIVQTNPNPEIYSHELADALGIAEQRLVDLASDIDDAADRVINGAAFPDVGVFLSVLGMIDPPEAARIRTAHALATAICAEVVLPSAATVDPRKFYGSDRGLLDLIRNILRNPPKDVELSFQFRGDKRGLRAMLTVENDGHELTFACLGREKLPTFHCRIGDEQIRDIARAIAPRLH